MLFKDLAMSQGEATCTCRPQGRVEMAAVACQRWEGVTCCQVVMHLVVDQKLQV